MGGSPHNSVEEIALATGAAVLSNRSGSVETPASGKDGPEMGQPQFWSADDLLARDNRDDKRTTG